MKKIICLTVISLFFLTGCTNKTLQKAYDQMQIGKELTAYTVDYRLYGTYQNKRINDIVRIANQNNKYTVDITDMDTALPSETNEIKQDTKKEKDTKIYENTGIYLKGLLKTKKVSDKKEEKIGENTYSVYDIKVEKNTIKEILKNTSVKDLKVENDISAKVYIDKDGYVYRIIYELDKANQLSLNVCYFGFQTK